MPVLISVLKPPLELWRVFAAFATLLVASATAMCGLVALSFAGAARFDFARVRRHERLFLGVSFIVLSAVSYLVLPRHNAHPDGGAHVAVMRQGAVLGSSGHRGCH